VHQNITASCLNLLHRSKQKREEELGDVTDTLQPFNGALSGTSRVNRQQNSQTH